MKKAKLQVIFLGLQPHITKLGEYQESLVDIGDRLSAIHKKLSEDDDTDSRHEKTMSSLRVAFSKISITYIMVGYDTEMLSMIHMIEDEYKKHCYQTSYMYMKNTYKLMKANHSALELDAIDISVEDATQLIHKAQTNMDEIFKLYDKCFEVLKIVEEK